MKNRVVLFACSAAFAIVAACGPSASPKPSRDLARVTAWKPGDEVQRLDAALQISFDRPMVPVDAVGPALQDAPVQIEPALPLHAHWDDRQTLIVRPETEWKAGRHYSVRLRGALAEDIAEPRGFAFDAQPLRMRWMTLSGSNVEREPKFDAVFSAAIDGAAAAAACVLVADDGKRVGLAQRVPSRDDAAERDPNRARFAVREELALQTHYVLDCQGLSPAGGDAPFRIARGASGFTTHGVLALARALPEAGEALPPERATLCLELSTPVTSEELARHVHVSPEPAGLAKGWYERACGDAWVATHRANSVLLPARGEFRVTVDAELTDVFGQKLGKTRAWTFKTGDRIPGLWTATGVGAVLEYGRSGHAAGALNLDSAALTCASLSPAQFVQGFERFQAWAFQPEDTPPQERAPSPWQLLGLTPSVHVLDSRAAPNAARTLPIDLGQRCGRGAGAPGLYALELAPDAKSTARGRQGDAPARLLANVTDLGVVTKRGTSGALVWVTRLSNGALVAGAQVEALDASGAVLATARTDARGLARLSHLPAPGDAELFAVHSGADVAVVGSHWTWREGLQSWQLDVREGDDDPTRLFVHTDRGVYRPGERVLLHGLVRRVSDTGPARIPSDRRVALRLEAENEVVYQRTLELSDYGSFSAEIDLPAHMPLGWHSLTVDAAGKQESFAIQVAEFRPATFEITGGPAQDEVLAPAQVRVDVAMRYLFGAPVASSPLHWTVERTPAAIAPAGFEPFRFEDSAPALPSEEPWPEAPSGLQLERADKTDAEGNAHLEFATEAARGPTRYSISAEGTDAGEDRAARSMSVLAHSAEVYVGARMTRWVFGAGEPIEAEVVLVDRHGKPVSGDAAVELRDERWACDDPLEACTAEVRSLETQRVSVTAGKPARVTFAAKAQGSVHVRAETSDAAGRRSRASDSAWVWSEHVGGPYDDRVAAPLNVDRRAYRVGDRARVALQTQLAPQHLLVTSERADVLSADVVPRAAGMPSIALGPKAAPNAFLTVTGMTPRAGDGEAGAPRLVSGAREVKVTGPTRALSARIELARGAYRPRERVEGDVVVTHLGKPVDAEVALVAVNESVLQLTSFATPDPTAVFHAPRGLSVRTASNITRVVADPAKAAQVPEVARAERAGGEDGAGGRPDARDDYVAAAYFAPHLRTDREGRARFAFDAPSDLSAYRVMVVAAAKDDRVGSADARFRVQQPLSVHPLVPRFLSRGDTLEVGALVHDTTGAAGATAVEFRASGMTLARGSASTAGAAAEEVVRTQARVGDVDRAAFDVTARKGAESDRVARELPVRRPLDTELRVLVQQRAAKVRAPLAWPKGIDGELSQLEITVDRAGLAPLAPLLVSVVDYPYGCTEQTAAALSAIAAAPELARAVIPGADTETRLRARVADGVGRLLQARAAAGGFGLYPGMNGRPWLSAIVLDAALAVRRAGMPVSDALADTAKNALSSWLSSTDVRALAPGELDVAAQSALLLAQSGAPLDALEEQLWQQRTRLTTDGVAFLLRTLARRGAHEDRRAALRARLRAADWLGHARDPEVPLSSTERTTALALLALLDDAHEPELSQKLAAWLIDRAGDPDAYFSTRDIADTFAALSAWVRGRQAGAGQVKVGLGKQVLWQGTLSGAQVVALARSANQVAAGGDVWIEADGDVSASVRRRDVSPTADKVAFSRGLSINRRYTRPKTDRPLDELALGDVVQVEVELRTDRAVRMVALTDPLPAGLEPLDPGLSNGGLAGCERCEENRGFDHVRRHDDRIEAFAEWLPAGTHVLRYLLRATTPGAFASPGATATLMYMPNYFARSSVSGVGVTR
jgi:uncharacterized protein YfaS (alpha-2-macroglobulin family)